MFHPLNQTLILWKAFLCLFILLENFSISIHLFFDMRWASSNPIVGRFQTALKVFLIIDIIIDCNTGIFKSGAVYFKRREIMMRYLRNDFAYDLITLTSLMLPYFGDSNLRHTPALLASSSNIFKLFFLLKLKSLSSVYKYLEEMLSLEEAYEGMLSLLKLFAEVIIISHFITCFWVYAAYDEKNSGSSSWIDRAFPDTDNYQTVEWNRAYLYAWYWSLTTMITVGYGDISPRNDKEVAVASIAMLFGCGFFAYAINTIGIIVDGFSLKKKSLKKVLRIINKYMRRKTVDYDLQVKIRKYLEHIWIVEEIENKDFERQIIEKLSTSLREELLVQAHGKILAKFDLFTKFFSIETLEKVSQIVKSVSYAPEDLIFFEGEASNDLIYFIIKGEVELYHVNAKQNKICPLKTLGSSDCFGQLSFFTEKDRELNARSKGFTSLYTIKREEFLSIVKNNQIDFENFHMIKDRINLYNDITNLGLTCYSCSSAQHILKGCPYLSFNPNREMVIKRFLHSEENERNFYRRKQRKHAFGLHASPDERLEEDGLSDESIQFSESVSARNLHVGVIPPESEAKKPNDHEEAHEPEARDICNVSNASSKQVEIVFEDHIPPQNIFRGRAPRHPTIKKTVIFNDKKNNDELTSIEENLFKRRSHQKFSTIRVLPEELGESNSSLRKKRVEPSMRQIVLTKSLTPGPGQPKEKEARLINNQSEITDDQMYFHKDISLIFGGLNIDKLANFSVYFPYNNSDIVVDFLNKAAKRSLASSKIKSEALTKNRVSNAVGLIEFRNQKLHFMKKQTLTHIPKESLRALSPKRGASVFRRASKMGFSGVVK